MARSILVCLILVALLCPDHTQADEAVLTLTAANFDKTIEDNPLIMVEFYAPWCGHCKRLAPEYEKAAQDLAGLQLPLAKVDADTEENRVLAQRFEIRGFPTLKLFRNGVPKDYQGGRTAADIVAFMKKQSLPVISELDGAAKLAEFARSSRVVIVGFFESTSDSAYTAFKSAAEGLRDDYLFGQVVGDSAASLAKAEGSEKVPSIVLYKQFDEGKSISSDFSQLVQFIKAQSLPLIDEIGPENYRTYVESGLPLAYLFVDLKVEGQKEENLAKIQDFAKSTKGKINFVYIDWSKYAKHSERLGLSGETVPALAIEEEGGGLHYAYPEKDEFSKEKITAWLDLFVNKKLEPTIKSEPIPESNDGPVTVLVAKNFDAIVKDAEKDVLVEFYAPWCGHCKKLAPIYDQLGEDFKKVPSVVIAKIDATANDVDPKLGIRGFPTLKFFKAGAKDTPLDYEGDRSLEDLKKFVLENASKKITLEATADGKDEL